MSAKSPWLGSGWRQDAYLAADQLSADAIADADAKLRQAHFGAEARALRDATYGAASDKRAETVAEAEQRHRDRLAAIQRRFGQQITSRGNPDASHSADFVEMVADPEGLMRHNPARLRSAGLSRLLTTASSARFASTPMVASSPRALSQTTDGQTAAPSLATPRPSWPPREPELG